MCTNTTGKDTIMNMPNDPAILLSFVNTMLRDKYDSLDELCDDYHADKTVLMDKLKSIGYEYSQKYNRFK